MTAKLIAPPPPVAKPLPSPPPMANPPPPFSGNGAVKLSVSTGPKPGAQRIVIYGPGGIGKTSLAASIRECGKRPLILDLDDGSRLLDVDRIGPAEGLTTWDALRAALQSAELWADHDVVVIDSATKAEELAVAWTLRHVPHPDRPERRVTRIEDYNFGKGYQFCYETFLQILGDLDAHIRAGRDVVIICHDCTANVPNPAGEDFLRYEPRLQSPASGKASIRHRVKEWCDHLLYIGYDVNVNAGGKARGSGTRTIYPHELPVSLAKSRSLTEPIVYEKHSIALWKEVLK